MPPIRVWIAPPRIRHPPSFVTALSFFFWNTIDIQHFGTLIAQIFFGLWLAPMGYLAYKSGWFPKALGVLLIAACVSYLVDLLVALLVPDVSAQIHGYLSILPAIAEVWMVGYLLVKGVKVPAPGSPTVSARQTSPVVGAKLP
jgi:hypothetical protein